MSQLSEQEMFMLSKARQKTSSSGFDGRIVEGSLEELEAVLRNTPVGKPRPTKPYVPPEMVYKERIPGLSKAQYFPKTGDRRPLGPSEPRTILGETAAAALRGVVDQAESYAKTALGLVAGPEATKSAGRIFPFGPQPSRDGLTGFLANAGGTVATQIGLAGGRARGPALAAAKVSKAALPLAAGATFGSTGFAQTLERTDNIPAALSSAGINAGLGLIPVGRYATENPLVQKAVEKLGSRTVGKILTKEVIEGLASGGTEVDQAYADEAVARLAGATPQDVKPLEQFAAGFLGQTLLQAPRTLNDLRRFRGAKNDATKAGLLTQEESVIIGDRPQLLADVLVARAKDNLVTIEADPKGGEPKTTVVPDTVTQHEKRLLGFSEPFIQAYREAKAKGAPPIDEFSTEAKWLLFPSSRDKGYFRSPENLAKRPVVQNKIAQLQRKTMLELSVLRNNAEGLTVSAKVRLAAQLDAEYSEKIEILLGKDNNSSTGARKKVVKAIAQLPVEQQIPATQALTKIIDTITEKFPYETQLGTMDRVLEELDTGGYPEASAARPMLVELREKMQTQAEYMPASERVRRSQLELRSTLEGLAQLEFGQGREAVSKAAKELPAEVRADLLDQAINATNPEQLKAIAESVAQVQEDYLRRTNTERLVEITSKIGRNPRRDDVIKLVQGLEKPLRSPRNAPGEGGTTGPTGAAKPAQANVAPTVASGGPPSRVAVRFRGKIETGGNTHFEVMQSVLARLYDKRQAAFALTEDRGVLESVAEGKTTSSITREAARTALDLLDLPDAAHVFLDDAGKEYSRAEAEAASKAGTAEAPALAPAQPKPSKGEKKSDTAKKLVKTSRKTGYVKVDPVALRKHVKELTSEQLQNLVGDLTSMLRRGQIEQGLYKKALKFDTAEDLAGVRTELGKLSERSESRQKLDSALHLAKLAADPVTVEADLEQLGPVMHGIFHGEMVRPYDAHMRNQTQRDVELDKLSKQILGIDAEGPIGKHRLLTYFNTVLPGTNITRGRAMTLYALSTDVGRAKDLAKYGAVDAETSTEYDLTQVSALSKADREFVDKAKAHLVSAGYIKKAYRNVLLLTGRLPGVVKGWFPSRRSPENLKLESDFDTFAEGLISEIDPLKDRVSSASGPFQISDFYSTLINVTDKLSLFGEVGKELYRADALLRKAEFKKQYVAKRGKAAYKSLQLYLANIHSQVGHTSTALDQAINKVQSGFTISRTALNTFSAAKQYLHLFTLLADGALSRRDVLGALTSGAAFKRSVRQEMIDNSGLAHQRYVGGHYMRNYLVLANENKLPSKLSVLQHYSMVLQRTADRQVMQISWEAAKRTAAREGYKGAELLARTTELFGIAAGRDQPTDNPLYAGELEIQARRQPLLRAAVMFQREQNRVYNVVRRRVVNAVKQPSRANIVRAGEAVLFGVVANTLAAVMINELRRAVFAKPSDDKDRERDVVGNVVGLYYLGTPVQDLANGLIDLNRRQAAKGLGPIAETVNELMVQLPLELARGSDAEGLTQVGVKKGEARSDGHYAKALDAVISGTSTLFGLPLWSIWMQSKGLYRWTDDQLRLMTYFEAEKQQLKADKLENSPRYRRLDAANDAINKIHRDRAAGLLRKEQAQRQIISELNRVLP